MKYIPKIPHLVKWSIHLSLISVGRDTVHATTTKICANYKTCGLHMQRTAQRHKRSVFCAPCRSTVLIYYNNNSKLGWKLIIQRTQFQTWRHIHCSTMKQWTFTITSLKLLKMKEFLWEFTVTLILTQQLNTLHWDMQHYVYTMNIYFFEIWGLLRRASVTG